MIIAPLIQTNIFAEAHYETIYIACMNKKNRKKKKMPSYERNHAKREALRNPNNGKKHTLITRIEIDQHDTREGLKIIAL